jgi:hypothetical protein
MTIEPEFYIPEQSQNPQQTISHSSLYYPAYAPMTYKQYIYTKSLRTCLESFQN